jgi:hypothetical protein
MKRLELELRGVENGSGGGLTGEQESRKALLQDRIPELKTFDRVLSDVIANGFGPESMKSMLRQYAINDAMLCLKARWLKKLIGVIKVGPLQYLITGGCRALKIDVIFVTNAVGRMLHD